MLIIRPEQKEVLCQYMILKFQRSMYDELMKTHREKRQELSEAAAYEFIRGGIHRAGQYGIDVESDVARFINLLYTVGEDFETRPEYAWIVTMLIDEESTPAQRMDSIYERLHQGDPSVKPED